jgi:hypothetical protein
MGESRAGEMILGSGPHVKRVESLIISQVGLFLCRFFAVSPTSRPLRFCRLIAFFGLRTVGALSCSKSARSFKRPLASDI